MTRYDNLRAIGGAILSSWWATLRRDRWAQLVLVIYTVNAAYYGLPLPIEKNTLLSYYITIFSLALAIVALRRGLRRITALSERSFWNDLTLA